ncbi:hypothetical protein EH32_08250 [Erythrobacter litoralis]|uniref:Uncharacterized protein n=1 Tax=Erythrobacter litoralis TaxID=39960 RepID=A0A074NMP6_9SPHN|nr:hypothetical protein EH32_08250 [Erythrobacter litoralis]
MSAAIRPRANVLLSDELEQQCAIMGIGRACIRGTDQPMGSDNADVVLVAEQRDGEMHQLEPVGLGALFHLGFAKLQNRGRIQVLLTDLEGFSFRRSGILPCLIAAFLSSLLRCCAASEPAHDGIDDLPARRR